MFKVKDRYIFLFFWIIIFVIYYPAKDAKFINDSFYYFAKIQQEGFAGIWDSYNIIFNFQLPCFLYYVFYKIFGLHYLGWHILFSLLHVANAYLWYHFILKSFNGIKKYQIIIASYLFLIAPFQTEVVAWGATLHYLLIVFFLISCLLLLKKYSDAEKTKYLILFHLSFFCSLFCFEQAFLFPILFSIYYFVTLENKDHKGFALKILLPNILMIAFYISLTKMIYGVYIAHYGKDVHTNLDIYKIYNTFVLYLYKYILLFRYLPEQIKILLEQEWCKIFFLIIIVIILFLSLRNKTYRKLLSFLILSYGLMIVPVLNLDTSFKFEIQSDRYGYLPSIFAYSLLIFMVFSVIKEKFAIVLFVIMITINMFFLIPTIDKWNKAGKYAIELLKNYPLSKNQKAYILNLPDNYQGAYMFRNSLDYGLHLYKDEGYNFEKIRNLAQINIFSNKNETETIKMADRTYQVTNIGVGKWYYRNGAGATNVDNDNYSMVFDEWLNRYKLTIKEKTKDTIFVLQCAGTQWKIIDTIPNNISEE